MKNTELVQNNIFISNIYKKALLPCMLSILSANINVIVDGILVGQKLGGNALAAINLCMPLNLLLCVIGSFISAGTAINSSKAIGQNQPSKSNEYYKLGVTMSAVVSILFTVGGIVFLNSICLFLCSDIEVFFYVHSYSLITIIGAIFRISIYIPFWYLRIDGQNKEISRIMMVLTFGNILLDILFVYIMNMGVFGAGLANVIATALAMLLGFYYLCNNKSDFQFNFKINISQISIKSIVADGLPSSLNNLCSTIRMLTINIILLSLGGASLVAIFTAVNGIFSIGECIILGIPQASNAMLGVYTGERDYNSSKLIIKTEMYMGAICSAIFFALCLLISPYVNNLYGISDSISTPVLLMAISIFPGLICNILSSYYNITGKNVLSSFIIVIRLIVLTYISINLAILININIFSFMLITELLTLLVIYIITLHYYLNNKAVDRFLLCKMNNELSGKVINFSVENAKQSICDASEKIADFCNNNGLESKDTMKIQLAIEEALVLVSDLNNNEHVELNGFDIRVFLYDDLSGIRIRYDGLDFNPFAGNMDTSDYMGIKMISDLLETVAYRRTFGVNTMILLLEDKA